MKTEMAEMQKGEGSRMYTATCDGEMLTITEYAKGKQLVQIAVVGAEEAMIAPELQAKVKRLEEELEDWEIAFQSEASMRNKAEIEVGGYGCGTIGNRSRLRIHAGGIVQDIIAVKLRTDKVHELKLFDVRIRALIV